MRLVITLSCWIGILSSFALGAKPEGAGKAKDDGTEHFGGAYCLELRGIDSDGVLDDGNIYCGGDRKSIYVNNSGSTLTVSTLGDARYMWLDLSQIESGDPASVPSSGLYEVHFIISTLTGGEGFGFARLDFYSPEHDQWYRIRWLNVAIDELDTNANGIVDSYYAETTGNGVAEFAKIEVYGSSETNVFGTINSPFAAWYWDREIE